MERMKSPAAPGARHVSQEDCCAACAISPMLRARRWSMQKRRTRRSIGWRRSEEHTSELQSLMRISYAVFCLKKKKNKQNKYHYMNKSTPTYSNQTKQYIALNTNNNMYH